MVGYQIGVALDRCAAVFTATSAFRTRRVATQRVQRRGRFAARIFTGDELRTLIASRRFSAPPLHPPEIDMAKATAAPGRTLLSPVDHTLIMIDHQSRMAFATKSIG